jgi:hypothetical protein
MTRKMGSIWLLTFIWNVMVFTLSIYIKLTAAKIEELMSFEKIATGRRKILFVATKNKKQKTSLLKKQKASKHALLLKDNGLNWNANNFVTIH